MVLEEGVPVPEVPDGPALDKIVVKSKDMKFVVLSTKKGRPRKSYNKEQLSEVLRLYFVEKMSMRDIGDLIGMSHMSVYRMLSDPKVEVLL